MFRQTFPLYYIHDIARSICGESEVRQMHVPIIYRHLQSFNADLFNIIIIIKWIKYSSI